MLPLQLRQLLRKIASGLQGFQPDWGVPPESPKATASGPAATDHVHRSGSVRFPLRHLTGPVSSFHVAIRYGGEIFCGARRLLVHDREMGRSSNQIFGAARRDPGMPPLPVYGFPRATYPPPSFSPPSSLSRAKRASFCLQIPTVPPPRWTRLAHS